MQPSLAKAGGPVLAKMVRLVQFLCSVRNCKENSIVSATGFHIHFSLTKQTFLGPVYQFCLVVSSVAVLT
jgi:hypothetical protein